MNHAPHLYFAWQQLVEKSQLMLRLATEEQWDELIASEMAYVNAVQEIAHLTEEVDPSTTMQEQLRPMLRLILDNESKVKQLLQIRMDELAKPRAVCNSFLIVPSEHFCFFAIVLSEMPITK